jgi:hypothetical protein
MSGFSWGMALSVAAGVLVASLVAGLIVKA